MRLSPNDERLRLRHRQAGILIDTNLLLVYFIQLCAPTQLARFKRTAHFTVPAAKALVNFVHEFSKIHTTPHILTEVSNLLTDELRQRTAPSLQVAWAAMVEHLLTAEKLALHSSFPKFGLTDAAIFALAEEQLLVLTNDFKLSASLERANLPVINFVRVQHINLGKR